MDWLKNPKVWLGSFLFVVFGFVLYIAKGSTIPEPQFSLSSAKWLALVVIAVAAFFFIWLFTKPVGSEESLDQDDTTRLWLIRFSYVFMLLALLGSILPFLSPGWGKKSEAPLSVLKACWKSDAAEGDMQTAKLEECGWVINIGGIVDNKSSEDPSKTSNSKINGGLVVPLYLVVLALIGGAVSLTRRVPEYQKQSSQTHIGTEKEPKLNISTLREFLVFQIVQFVSAPLLAVVAYSMFSPAETRSVVALGFTAGFASETILLMIRAAVEKVNPGEKTGVHTGTIGGLVLSNSTGQKGVKLSLIGSSPQSTETDEKGYFVLPDIPAGEYAIEASYKASDGQEKTQLVKFIVEAGKAKSCHIVLGEDEAGTAEK